MNTQLLDRETEISDVIEIINAVTENNKIIFLTGISGVGKSGLIEKLILCPLLKNIIISVKISKSSVDTIENLQYFNAIYKAVTKYAKTKMFDKILSPAQQGVKNGKNLYRIVMDIIKSKLGLNEITFFAEPEECESIIRKKEYLSYILKKTNVILDIENIQNIDTQSFEILKEIILESTNTTFIFEYTLSKNSFEHYENMYKEFKEVNSDIWCYKVEKMDFLIAKRLAPQNIPIDEEGLYALYEKSEGNLMEIILANADINTYTSNITTKLNCLSKNEKYILYIVYLNDSPLYYDKLAIMTIIESPEKIIKDFELLKCLVDELCNKKILVMDKDFVKIKHDSIIESLEHNIPTPILYCAYATIKEYYNKRLDSEPVAVEKLLFLYLKFSDQELLTFLEKVKKFILNLKYPDLIIKKLGLFREDMLCIGLNGFNGTYYLTLMIVEICLNKKMGDEAQKNLDLIFDESNAYHIALQAQILSLQENHESHEALQKLIFKTPANSRLRLVCEICILYLKTKLFPSAQTKLYGEKLIQNNFYREYLEYAFLLRNYAELCDDTETCNNLYIKALDIFENNKMFHEMATVYISLSMIHAYDGNISLANRYIEDALSLDSSEVSMCYILNNKSALQILENSYNETTEKNLRNALLLSVSNYEKIIVNANLLVYYCLIDNFTKAKEIAYNIENSTYKDFRYEELLHIVYQNLYYFYSVFKHDSSKKTYYYNQILILVDSPNIRESTKELASGMNHLIKSQTFYAQFPYRVDFLGYWEFTIDSTLSC